MRFLLFTISICCFIPIYQFSVSAENLPEEYSLTAVNVHKDGGLLKKWLVLGPFHCPAKKDTFQKDSLKNSIDSVSCIDHDFLHSLGGESTAVIKNKTSVRVKLKNRRRKILRPVNVETNSGGIIILDSIFSSNNPEVVYAYCMVEAFIPCSVRCWWGIDGKSKVWINGKRMKNEWDSIDTCRSLSKFFDVNFKQGMNTVLIKTMSKRKKCRFIFETYNIRDGLLPFQKKVDSIYLTLSDNNLHGENDTVSAVLKLELPSPPGMFKGDICFYKGETDTLNTFTIPVEKPFKISIPDSAHGIVKIAASVKLSKRKQVGTSRYIFKGNFSSVKDSLFFSLRSISGKIDYAEIEKPFSRMLINGAAGWVRNWFEIYDSLCVDERIRQLKYISENYKLIDVLISKGKIPVKTKYPLYLFLNIKKDKQKIYDPSGWLNYKFPDKYRLPEGKKTAQGYPFWIYLPKSAKSKRKKMPLIISLHGAGERGFDISMIKDYGPAGYSGEVKDFPFAVITPQCENMYLWDAVLLKALIDTLIATSRFDKKHIYITGFGMGAFTAWHLACTYPELFAAIVPINGGGNKDKACNCKKVSVLAFYGEIENEIPKEKTEEMINRLKACSRASVNFTIVSKGQEILSNVYKKAELYKWLKKQ